MMDVKGTHDDLQDHFIFHLGGLIQDVPINRITWPQGFLLTLQSDLVPLGRREPWASVVNSPNVTVGQME